MARGEIRIVVNNRKTLLVLRPLCRYFTWDKTKFSQPEEMIGGLAGVGRKLVNIVDPHVKVDSGYSVYQECKDKDLFVKDKSGNEFNGWCWPGNSAYADFLNPAAREWFAEQYKFDKYTGKIPKIDLG